MAGRAASGSFGEGDASGDLWAEGTASLDPHRERRAEGNCGSFHQRLSPEPAEKR